MKKYPDFSLTNESQLSKGLRGSGRIRASIIRLRLFMIMRIPVRITIRRIKGRKLLDLSSSRVENIDYPMTHLRENYYPSSAANLHYELFSPSGAIRNRHFRLSHHTPRRTAQASSPPPSPPSLPPTPPSPPPSPPMP